MILGNLMLMLAAWRAYQHAASLPAQRITGVQKVERTIVRAARGFEKTYASRPALIAAIGISVVRLCFELVLLTALTRASRRFCFVSAPAICRFWFDAYRTTSVGYLVLFHQQSCESSAILRAVGRFLGFVVEFLRTNNHRRDLLNSLRMGSPSVFRCGSG